MSGTAAARDELSLRLVGLIPRQRVPAPMRYALATGAIALMLAIRLMLPVQQLPYLLFIPAVFGVSLALGFAAGLYSLVLSTALALALIIGPAVHYRYAPAQLFATLLYFLVCLALVLVCDAVRRYALAVTREREAVRASQAQLALNQANLRLALEAGRLGVWELALGSGLLTCSPLFKANYGRAADAPLGWDEVLAATLEDDRPAMLAALDEAQAGGRPYAALFRVRWPDGSVHWLEARGRVERDEAGTAMRLAGVTVDVTDRAEREARMGELNLALEHAVDERTAELRRRHGELEAEMAARTRAEEALRQAQKMEAIGQLTGGVAHDFNNLLTIIKSSTELLSRPALDEARRQRYVAAIADTADRAAGLTQQLLAFARRQPLTPTLFDVDERVAALLPLLRTTLGATVELAFAPGHCGDLIEVDLNQFEAALLNMTVNARDAMPDGGRLDIAIGTADALPGGATAGAGFVTVALGDNGAGIDAATLARVFEPFYTTKDVGKGTGLGLSQVYGFTRQSNGEVAVESRVGAGSRFTLFLPRAVAGERPVARGAGADPAVGAPVAAAAVAGRATILVVEDNELVGEFAAQLIEELGYATRRVTDAAAALDLLAREAEGFAAVFTDVVMPGMSGIDLALTLRERQPALPVVLTSGYSHALAVEGAHGFDLLRKPYSAGNVAATLARVLDAAGEARSAAALPAAAPR